MSDLVASRDYNSGGFGSSGGHGSGGYGGYGSGGYGNVGGYGQGGNKLGNFPIGEILIAIGLLTLLASLASFLSQFVPMTTPTPTVPVKIVTPGRKKRASNLWELAQSTFELGK